MYRITVSSETRTIEKGYVSLKNYDLHFILSVGKNNIEDLSLY